MISAAPKYLGVAYSKMDCQAFVEKVMADAGFRKNLAGSNAWYRFALKHGWVGTPEECRKKYGKIPKGAFLFILLSDGREPEKYQGDGIGNASHIGIYTGQTQEQMLQEAFRQQGIQDDKAECRQLEKKAGHGNGAINSSSTWGCVATSKFQGKSINGGWNRVWLWTAMIDYENEESKPMAKAKVVLAAGSSGSTVNMRNAPRKGAEVIVRVPVGAEVEVLADHGQWCWIRYAGNEGYMMSNYIEYEGQGDETAAGAGLSDADRQTIDEQLKVIEKACDTIGAIVGRG